MIKLFITDLDGCISMPFIPPKWDAIRKIIGLNQQSRTDLKIPPLTICTGRRMLKLFTSGWECTNHFYLKAVVVSTI